MANTPNLGLYKPNRADEVEVDVSLAQNFDIIDTELTAVEAKADAASTKATALEIKTTDLTNKVSTTETGLAEARVRLTDVEYEVEALKTSGGTGGSAPGFVDGGTFLDTYTNEGNLDGGEF